MQMEHSSCSVCRAANARFCYFRTPSDLRSHVNEHHHACPNPDCQQACVAFASAEELRTHHVAEHSKRLPRMDRTRAYRLEIEPPRPTAALGHASTAGSGGHRRRGPRGHNHAEPAPAPSQQVLPARRAHEHELAQHEGFVMFDDAEGTVQGRPSAVENEFPSLPDAVPAAQWWQQQQRLANRADNNFPSLDESASAAQDRARNAPKPPPLVRKQAVCPCGRRRESVVVREGVPPGELHCNGQCAAAQRQRRLAEAFGRDADSPATLLPTQAVEWPPDLVMVRIKAYNMAFHCNLLLLAAVV